jgi:hypothetical protein
MEPLTHPVNPLRIRRQRARYIVRLLDSCAYHVRSLAAIAESASDNLSAELALTDVVQRIDRNAATLADFLRERDGNHDGNHRALQTEPSVSEPLHELHSRADAPDSPDRTGQTDQGSRSNGSRPPEPAESAATLTTMRILRHLQRVDEGLLGLARPLGLASAAESAAEPVNRQVPYPA